jgi:putative acetyltransferase
MTKYKNQGGMMLNNNVAGLEKVDIPNHTAVDNLELVKIYSEASSRMNWFLSKEALIYKKAEMEISILPIAQSNVIEINGRIAGFISCFDDYIIGIFVRDEFLDQNVESRLFRSIKGLHPTFEVMIDVRNATMLNFYLETGFEVTDYYINKLTNDSLAILKYFSTQKPTAVELTQKKPHLSSYRRGPNFLARTTNLFLHDTFGNKKTKS